MDSSTNTAQQSQLTGQPINRAQPPDTAPVDQQNQTAQPVQQPPQQKMPQSISINKEGQSVVIQEVSDSGEDDEEELKVAPQETKTQVAGSQGGADQEENAEIQKTPEVVTGSVETEKAVENVPEAEKPPISEKLQKPPITHSGPGAMIDVDQNDFGVKKMPAITYPQAAAQVKKTGLHDSKHWFMAMMMYIWRKVKPGIEKEQVAIVEPVAEKIEIAEKVGE